jgi:hypothetical protein
MWQDSTTIITVIELNIRIRGKIFHIYRPISWKNFTSINTVKLTARGARDQLNVAHASPLPWPGGPLRAPPNHGNGADCGAALRERAHA